jgi:hypothetical protein
MARDRTKLKAAPLPNGGQGGMLSRMSNRFNDINNLELRHLESKHELERANLLKKQTDRQAKAQPSSSARRSSGKTPYNPMKKVSK